MFKTNTSNEDKNAASAKVEVIKLGQDLHAAQVTVVVQLDGSLPKRAQRIAVEEYLGWIRELKGTYPKARFHSCYEAGPCGYWLHRELHSLGVNNIVVAPTNLSGRRKTDKRDARKLVEALDRYLAGNTDAFSVVTVPTPEQEQRRGLPRHRSSLVKQRKRCMQQGSSLLLCQGIRLGGSWCVKRHWERLQHQAPAWVLERLCQWKELLALYDRQIDAVDIQIQELAKQLKMSVPKGLGTLTCLILLLESIDWSRFKNRRQVSSYTGLCPSEFSSGESRKQGCIDRHGNPRVRHALVEAVWRLAQWQPDYPPLRRLAQAKDGRARRKAVVAIARRLAVDLWRLATGQTTPDKLGLIMVS